MNLGTISVDLPYTYTMYVLGQYKFKCFVYTTSLSYVSHSVYICTVAIKNIRNMDVVSNSQIYSQIPKKQKAFSKITQKETLDRLGLFRTLPNISYEAFLRKQLIALIIALIDLFCEDSVRLLAVNLICKKIPPKTIPIFL